MTGVAEIRLDDKTIVGAPKVQVVPTAVVFVPLAAVVWSLTSRMPPLGALAATLPIAAALFLLMRTASTRWVAAVDGLEFEGLMFRYWLPVAEIQSVALHPDLNVLRVRCTDRTGRSVPLGNAIATNRSLARGRELGTKLAEIWAVDFTEAGTPTKDGHPDPARVPKSQIRRFRNGPAIYVAIAASLVPVIVSIA